MRSSQQHSFDNSEIGRVDVELRGYMGNIELPKSPLSTITPTPCIARNSSTYEDVSDLNRTANFLIPNDWMWPGIAIDLVAKVRLLPSSFDSVDPRFEFAKLSNVTFNASNPLGVVLVLVRYTGPTDDPVALSLPLYSDAIRTLTVVKRVFPTDKLKLYFPLPADQIIEYDGSGGGGACGGFSALLDKLQDIAEGYDGDDNLVWWAIVQQKVNGVSGCGSGWQPYAKGYAASRVTSDSNLFIFADNTAMHEFGHAYGRNHAHEDSSYPDYGKSNKVSIGMYGVDVEKLTPYNPSIANNYLYNPLTAADYMSYDPLPNWTSPYTYMGLMTSFFSTNASVGIKTLSGPKLRKERTEQLFVSGVLLSEKKEVKLNPLYHYPVFCKPATGDFTRYEMALVDNEGVTLEEEQIQSAQCRKWRIRISQTISFNPAAVALEVRDGEKVLIRIRRPEGRPVIENVGLIRDKRLRLSWEAHHTEKIQLFYSIAITFDNGEHWQRIAKDLNAPLYEFDPNDLPGGENCRLRILATDGFNTVFAETDNFDLPIKPPVIIPVNLKEGDELPANEKIHLVAEAISPRFGSIAADNISWSSDCQGELGLGNELVVILNEGLHQLTITAKSTPRSIGSYSLRIRAVKR